MKKYCIKYAHTLRDKPKEDWQSMKEHLLCVANIAKNFADPYGLGQSAYWAGLFHDMGKYDDRFQDKLHKINSNFKDHSSAGAKYLVKHGHVVSSFSAFAHHIGLKNPSEMRDTFKELDISSQIDDFNKEIGITIPIIKPEKPSFELACDIRFVTSCLVDADRLDTERFCNSETLDEKIKLLRILDHNYFINKLEDHIEKFDHSTKMGSVRQKYYNNCVETALNTDKTIFSLTGSTGIGKTFSSLAFALHYAKRHNKKRIFIVPPYMTIIEQTAKSYKNVFGEDRVLEHYSGIRIKDDERFKYNFLSESWATPIVVTTSSQFFDTIMSNHPSDLRKVHNIADSVIIFDEPQTIPFTKLKSTLSVIEYYNKKFGCVPIFSTATQPCFDNLFKKILDKDIHIHEIIDNPEYYRSQLKRVKIVYNAEPVKSNQIADKLLSKQSSFCIVNTKRDAKDIYGQCLAQNKDHEIVYMTTGLTSNHRKVIIQHIRESLASNKKIVLVCTQLIEAGVDLDFSYGMRMMSPLDSIIQAAGRVNREGNMSETGILEVFELDGQDNVRELSTNIWIPIHYPDDMYFNYAKKARLVLQKTVDVDSPEQLTKYYNSCFNVTDTDKKCIYENLNGNIDKRKYGLAFTDAEYNFIDAATISVIAPYGDALSVIEELKSGIEMNKQMMERCKGNIVNFYQNKIDEEILIGNIDPIAGEFNRLAYWTREYNVDTGLD